jgi:hypothetical protein
MKKIEFKLPKVTINGIDVIKNALFFVSFLLLTLIFIIVIIAPTIKKFKKTKNIYYEKKFEYESTLKKYKHNLKELNAIKLKNRKIILNLQREFSITNFKNFTSQYMKLLSIKKIKTEQKDYIITTFKIKAIIKTPKDLYLFIKGLKNYKYLIQIDYPISFRKKNKYIEITFNIKVYKI